MKIILQYLTVAATAMLVLAPADSQAAKKKRNRRKAQTEQSAGSVPQPEVCPEPADNLLSPSTETYGGEQVVYSTNPADLDVLLSKWYEENVFRSMDEFFDVYTKANEHASTPAAALPDSVYERRLRELVSPIPLAFNGTVKNFINVYAGTSESKMADILRLAPLFMPMVEEELIKAGLPVELRMMPVIESALNTTVMSRAGAVGLWQFMPATAKIYGLEVNSLVDERCDPVAATRAACRYMKDMYSIYGDWTLAIASYNCGSGNVNKAIARAGKEGRQCSFWDIYDFLPRETRGYVPAFIAATYAYAYHRNHGMGVGPAPRPLATDTIRIEKVMHLQQISSTIECPIETLRALNPQYKMDIIPASTRAYTLVLPQSAVSEYIEHETEIIAKDSMYLKEYLNPSNLDKKRAETTAAKTYKVKRGDTLGAIARKHHVTVANLMKWNNIKKANSLREGQVLRIYR